MKLRDVPGMRLEGTISTPTSSGSHDAALCYFFAVTLLDGFAERGQLYIDIHLSI